MTANTPLSNADLMLREGHTTWSRYTHPIQTQRTTKFPPHENIDLWLKDNAPQTFEQLVDIRYALYHQCSRADFVISRISDDEFDLTGRHGTLRVQSNKARQYLLWKLRQLGRANNWIGALPRTSKAKNLGSDAAN